MPISATIFLQDLNFKLAKIGFGGICNPKTKSKALSAIGAARPLGAFCSGNEKRRDPFPIRATKGVCGQKQRKVEGDDCQNVDGERQGREIFALRNGGDQQACDASCSYAGNHRTDQKLDGIGCVSADF